MSRRGWLILGLAALSIVLGLIMTSDPEHAGRLAEARRDAAFTGESRDMVLMLLALGVGGFIAYLALTRR
jgi:hypothetical protein